MDTTAASAELKNSNAQSPAPVIAVARGDGIGPEIMYAVLRIIEASPHRRNGGSR